MYLKKICKLTQNALEKKKQQHTLDRQQQKDSAPLHLRHYKQQGDKWAQPTQSPMQSMTRHSGSAIQHARISLLQTTTKRQTEIVEKLL